MAATSPPKPWETRGVAWPQPISAMPNSRSTALPSSSSALVNSSTTTRPSIPTTTPSSSSSASTAVASSSSSSSSQAPALPAKPRTLKQVVNRTAANYTPPYQAAARYGTSAYGTLGSYTSPYNRFGGNMYGGGYGGLYGGIGGYGGGLGGYGGFQPNINDPNSLTNTFNQSTQATFQIIESIVQAFGGFAQMLESTYMATHSSFFAIVQVAEQFGNLRNTLGSILGIFALLRWVRKLFAKLTGQPIPSSSSSKDLTPSNFFLFQQGEQQQQPRPGHSSSRPSPSKKPLLVFLLAVFGLPLIMGKLIRALSRQSHDNSTTLSPQLQSQSATSTTTVLDPSKLSFCRVIHDYTPSMTDSDEISVKKGDLVAVLSRTDPLGQPSDWWRCRTRDARVGWLPCTYLKVIKKEEEGGEGDSSLKKGISGQRSPDGDRNNNNGQSQGQVVVAEEKGEITAEGFRRSAFYS